MPHGRGTIPRGPFFVCADWSLAQDSSLECAGYTVLMSKPRVFVTRRIPEAGLSRIAAGVHTRTDHDAGTRLGRRVAAYVLRQWRSTWAGKLGR